jgi:hypothetical protein
VRVFNKFIEGIKAIFGGIDVIEFIVVLCLGTGLFVTAIWAIAKKILASGSTLYLLLFIVFLIVSLSSVVRDCIYRRFGKISKFFLVCWGICVLVAGWFWFR